MALAVAGLPALLTGWGLVSWLLVAIGVFLVAMPLWSRIVEGRRAAVDRLVTTLVWASFAFAMAPLVWLLWVVLKNGLPAINGDFLTYSMLNVVGDEQGGILHALIGTLLITLAATVMSVPIGILTAIYLVEYGAALARRPGDHLPGRRDDGHPVDRGRPLRAVAVRAALRPGATAAASAARSPSPC